MEARFRHLAQVLERHGLDLVQPFNTKWYNSHAKPLLELIDLPVGRDGAGLPAILIGNTKAIWPAFLQLWNGNPHDDNPLDSFVEKTVDDALNDCYPTDERDSLSTFFVHDTRPTKLIAFQRLATVCNLAYLDEDIHLCLHAKYGPWIALRAIVVFEHLTLSDFNLSDLPPKPLYIEIPEQERALAIEKLALAVQASKERDPLAWRKWMDIRETIHLGKEFRYDDDQLMYHYTKDKKILNHSYTKMKISSQSKISSRD